MVSGLLLLAATGHLLGQRPSHASIFARGRVGVARGARAVTMASSLDTGVADAADSDEARSFASRWSAALSSAGDDDPTLLGSVVRHEDKLLVLEPPIGVEPPPGSLVTFAGGGCGTVLFCRVGLAFAAQLDGPAAALGEKAALAGGNLTFAPVEGQWGGASSVEEMLAPPSPDLRSHVFAPKVAQSRRAPISHPLHTGVLAIDSLAPIGRGQSMLILGPDTLPRGAGRSALAHRVLDGAASFAPDVRRLYVTTAAQAEDAGRAAWAEGTRVLSARTDAEMLIAAQAACSLAQAGGGDALVVVDDLEPLRRLWTASCDAATALGREVRPDEEGSLLRIFYSALTERAHRRIGGDSVTLLLLQPSPSLRAAEEARKEAFTLADFEKAGFSQRAMGRLRVLEGKGVQLTEGVLEKLGIPAPGSGHPRADGGRKAGQHVEELTSLVDGHIELSEALAAAGRLPPIDPAQSLTRIGVGSTKLRPQATSAAMRAVARALRLELASAADPVHCEPSQRRRAAACTRVLQQPGPAPLGLAPQVALLFAATDGLLDEAIDTMPDEQIQRLLAGLVGAVDAAAPELLPKVGRSADLTQAQADELRAVIGEYVAGFRG